MNRELFIQRANERYQKAREFWRNWRTQARDDYAFISGDQWQDEDKAILEIEKRPPITFNYSEKMVDAVLGAEISNRQETSFKPRGLEDSPLADLWNAAAKYVRDECNAEDEESDAFRDMLICGLGWTWTRMSYEEDLDGKTIIERVDPLEMYPDPAASKAGLKDRRWHDRLWWVDEREVKRQWPNADFSAEDDQNTAHGTVRRGMGYNDEDSRDDDRDRREGQVQLRLHETYEMEDIYRVASGEQIVELSPEDFKKLQAQMPLPEGSFVKQKKRVYYRAFFAGETLLEVKKSPCQDGFCFQAITGKRDRNRNTWYGLTRIMKDPQRWANKWLSQILHIINSNAKGGLMAEIGAFVDPVKAREDWAKPDSVTLFNEGALSGKKVQQKQVVTYPAGLDKLMEFALGSLPMVTGINLEALGLANREQAGVLESQRKQAAYGLLSPFFDAIRRYRKEQGRILLSYIRNYLSDGRLVRIVGPEHEQFLPLTKAPDAAKFDIIVDQAPNAPDTKQKTWESLVELIPAFLKAGIPLPPDLLDYTPLPSGLVLKWKQFIGQQQQVDAETQEQMKKLEEENAQLKNDQQIKMQELEFERQKVAMELEMEQQRMQAQIQMEREQHEQKMQLEREKAQASFELESFKQDREFELEGRRAEHESKMQQQKVDNDFRIKSVEAGMKPDDAGKLQIDVNTNGMDQILEQLAQTSAAIAQQAHAGNAAVLQSVERLAQVLSRPRTLTYDQSGRPTGSTVQ